MQRAASLLINRHFLHDFSAFRAHFLHDFSVFRAHFLHDFSVFRAHFLHDFSAHRADFRLSDSAESFLLSFEMLQKIQLHLRELQSSATPKLLVLLSGFPASHLGRYIAGVSQ